MLGKKILLKLREMLPADTSVLAYGTLDGRLHIGVGCFDELVVSVHDDAQQGWDCLDQFLARQRGRFLAGYVSYEANHERDARGSGPRLHFICPQAVLDLEAGQTSSWRLQGNAWPMEGGMPDPGLLAQIEPLPCQAGTVRDFDREPAAPYVDMLEAVLSDIRADALTRLTVARRVRLPAEVDPLVSLPASRWVPQDRQYYWRAADLEFAGMNCELLATGTPERFDCWKLSGTALPSEVAGLPAPGFPYSKLQLEHESSMRQVRRALEGLGQVDQHGPERWALYNLVHWASRFDVRPADAGASLARMLRAVLPCGGGPRAHALSFIRARESGPRGPYYGLVGCLTADGRLEFSQVIRTLFRQAGESYCWVGAAVTPESTAEGEYQETRVKLASIPVCGVRPETPPA